MVGRRVLLVGVALLCLLVLADVVGADAVYKKRRKAKDPANGDVKKQKKNANGILDVNQNVISDTKEGFNHVRKRELDSDADQKMIQEQLENAAKEGRDRYQRNVKRLQREEDGKRNRMKKKQNGWKKHHQNFRSEQREKKAQLKQKLKDRVSEHDRDLSKYELSQQKLRRAAKTEAELKKAARLAHLMAIKKQRDQAAAASTGRSREMARKQHAIDRARDKEAIDRDVRDERRQKKRHALYKRSFKKEQAERDTKFKAWKIRERKRKNAREARLKQKEKTYKKHQKERARKLRKDN